MTTIHFVQKKKQNRYFKTNLELGKISKWFRANKLSLIEDKTRFTLFHRTQDTDNLPLKLPDLKIMDYQKKMIIFN